ncbi:MAG: multicopper oxidase domain-containing protein [Bacteroidetes bacterium]|jgi:FtsP/CotA-like multicopper oxidase with cupredoxin domain|nr:multicopper oxidase domain-containing protein [Bacteroidota bacterium]
MMRIPTTLLALSLISSNAWSQMPPPQLFAEMDGIHFLADGTALPLWGYGWVADGFITLPGPFLTYTEGEEVDLNFTNPSPESHTIHLHGLDVDQANDGVPTTSFFVVTGQSTTYSFTADRPGTFLYHCHVTTTLHLTMGMYGMILVTRPDMTIFEGGPSYDQDVPLFFSDLEIATNLDPVGSFPFHTIRTDVFMVNGKADSQLEQAAQIVHYEPGQTLALRLGSMAYSRVMCTFPAALNAVCHMSDGRPVPESFQLDSLEIYPGERFTVLITPEADWDGTIDVEYWNMADGFLEDIQMIRVRDAALDITESDRTPWAGFPNPTQNIIHYPPAFNVTVWDAWGRQMFQGDLPDGQLHVQEWPVGSYLIRSGAGPVSRFVVTE